MNSYYKQSVGRGSAMRGSTLQVYLCKDNILNIATEFVFFNPKTQGVQKRTTNSGQDVIGLLLSNGTFRIRSANRDFYKELEIPKISSMRLISAFLIEDL